MKALARALGDLARLLARLLADPTLPRPVKIALVAIAVYLVSPIDLVPDFVPWIGIVDDVILGAIILDGILQYVDRPLLLKYWPGSPESLQRLAKVAHTLSIWVPARVKARIFAPGR